RPVVKNIREAAVPVANRQRIIGHEPLGEDLLVSLPGSLRLGEVLGEIRADEFFPRGTCHVDGSLVDVGDLSLGTDRDQGVEACFEQAPGISRSRSLLRHIPNGRAGGKAVWAFDRTETDFGREFSSILAEAP